MWDVSLVVDRDGVVHAAADEPQLLGSSLYHITNATGGWTDERLLRGRATAQSVTAFWAPTIATDTDGRISIAFQFADNRYPDELGLWYQATPTYLISNRSGGWSNPVQIGQGDAPSVVVRDGAVHFAAQRYFRGDADLRCGEDFELTYRTTASGRWTSEQVAHNGLSARLALTAQGLPRILYSGTDYACASGSTIGPGLIYAAGTRPTGRFALQEVPGTPYDQPTALGIDALDRPHLLLFRGGEYDAESFGETWYVAGDGDGWSRYERALQGARPMDAALDDDGFFHLLARKRSSIVYATNRGGSWQSTQLWSRTGEPWSAEGALALDTDGRPHVLLSIQLGRSDAPEHRLLYAVGPAR